MTPLQLNEARLESLYQWFLTQRRWKSVESEPALFKEAMREFAVETVHEARAARWKTPRLRPQCEGNAPSYSALRFWVWCWDAARHWRFLC